jgi:hypothetical protein
LIGFSIPKQHYTESLASGHLLKGGDLDGVLKGAEGGGEGLANSRRSGGIIKFPSLLSGEKR